MQYSGYSLVQCQFRSGHPLLHAALRWTSARRSQQHISHNRRPNPIEEQERKTEPKRKKKREGNRKYNVARVATPGKLESARTRDRRAHVLLACRDRSLQFMRGYRSATARELNMAATREQRRKSQEGKTVQERRWGGTWMYACKQACAAKSSVVSGNQHRRRRRRKRMNEGCM